MSELPPTGDRLDSWKTIAEYLQRDLATVRRWEKSLGLPVRRIAGTGRSVFAYTSEVDAWLQTARPILAVREAPLAPPAPAASSGVSPWRWLVLTVAVLAIGIGLFVRARRPDVDDLRVEVTPAGVIARDSAGAEQWQHRFPAMYTTFMLRQPVQVVSGQDPGVYVATSYRGRRGEDQVEGGALTLLDLKGNPQRSFSFDDRVIVRGTSYGPPWAVTGFAVDEASRRIVVAAHHHVWDPGLVTILDEEWQRRGTFVHAGWIEAVRWLGPERLLIGGFSNARDGGMIAVLDAAALDGQGPEPPGSPHFCETCGPGRPLRMFVFPRTELNRITGSRFNRVIVNTTAGRLFARTIEMSSAGGDADAVYEFTSALDLVGARFSERYWDMHRVLETEGRLDHSRAECPDRDGPRELQVWDASTGWRTVLMR